MTREEIKKHSTALINHIKKNITDNKKKYKGNVSSTNIDIWTQGWGDSKTYTIAVDGTHLINGLKYSFDFADIMDGLVKELKELKKIKGWTNLIYNIDTTYINSRPYNVVSRVSLVNKPCKEYKSLQNYLNKYGNADLQDYDLFSSWMGGKRGRLYGEEGERNYLCHKDKKCNNILTELRQYRGSKDKMTCRKKMEDYIDPMEKAYSEYHEVECSGEKRSYLEVVITTPSGKEKYSTKIY